jgi:hypothetical protein
LAFQYGATVYPLDVGANSSLLPVCDPALAKILDYLRFVLRKYAERAFLSTFAIPATDRTKVAIESVVEQVAPIDPDTIALSEQFTFPLLCGWPKSVKYNHRTLNWICDVRTVGLAYILSPLAAHQSVLWTPFLNSVSQICNGALKAGHDDDYNDGERIVADNKITSAILKTADFGHFKFGDKQTPPYFPAWVAELELIEQQTPYTVGLTPLQGIDLTVKQQALPDLATRVTADASAAATSLQVASSDGFVEFDAVRIGEGTAREEVAIVSAVPDTTHLSLASGLSFAHTAAQADVVKRDPFLMLQAKSDVE